MLRMKWATSSGLTAPPMMEDMATFVDFLPVRPDSTSSTINSTGIDWPPYTRGPERYRAAREIVANINRMAAGMREAGGTVHGARLRAFGRDPRAAPGADRVERVVVDLAPRHHRDPLVEQRDERAQQPRLGLAAQTEQDEVVLRQQRVHQLRDDGVVVADDAGEQRLAGAKFPNEVVADLLMDAPVRHGAAFDRSPQLA